MVCGVSGSSSKQGMERPVCHLAALKKKGVSFVGVKCHCPWTSE